MSERPLLMIPKICLLVLISPAVLASPQDASCSSRSGSSNRAVELHITYKSSGSARAANDRVPGSADTGRAKTLEATAPREDTAVKTSAKLTRRERIRALAERIRGAEETLLYDQAAESRAIDYNAKQRVNSQQTRAEAARLKDEHFEYLKGLAGDYRLERSRRGTQAGKKWMNRHKRVILREIRLVLALGRKVKSVDRSLEELNRSDSRLRQLIAWKRDERAASRRRQTQVVSDVPAIEVPSVPVVESRQEMSKEELEIFKQLFPTDQ